MGVTGEVSLYDVDCSLSACFVMVNNNRNYVIGPKKGAQRVDQSEHANDRTMVSHGIISTSHDLRDKL